MASCVELYASEQVVGATERLRLLNASGAAARAGLK